MLTFLSDHSLGNVHLDISLGKCSLETFRFETFVWELSFGNFRSGVLVWDISLNAFRLGFVVWEISINIFRLGTVVRCRAPWIVRFETVDWHVLL